MDLQAACCTHLEAVLLETPTVDTDVTFSDVPHIPSDPANFIFSYRHTGEQMTQVLESTPATAPTPPSYVAPQLTRQGQWQTVTLLVSIPMGPGNFSLPGMNDADQRGG
ncbi:hypothetical protein GCM10008957_43680 [Deinococcus ruber]|uniref:Uncharacterized protein n=1 Tax=Deinococcus ruber TaxID=1848197 RepID=A0A918FBG1_9DEIO|nr:hypothetical protein GCM10008957_43680 [Deinococcus ruber]